MMNEKKTKGRLTLPSEENFFDQTNELLQRLGADALRDSDGTKLPDEIKDLDAEIYTTYFVARDLNDFANAHLDEVTRFYLTSKFITATEKETTIDLLDGYYKEQIDVDSTHDPKKWWEVINRTTGQVVETDNWKYDGESKSVKIKTDPFNVYSVSFLALGIWDPTQMYNHITNDWGDAVAHHIPVDARYDNTFEYMKDSLEKWLEDNPKTDVVRFTTFFYHFTLVFNDKAKEKYVDWFGYSNTVSPKAIEEFEKEYGYRLRPEVFVDEGYYNSTFRIPSKEFLDYMEFQQKFVTQKAKEIVDLVHDHGKKAIMFLGDNWIGTEPYGKYFKDIGLDGVVGSVGDGLTLRLISNIDTPMTEGRFLPYFFPDTFYEGNDPTVEAVDNWTKARRALIRKPLDRIGYGGYLSLAYKFPDFIDYMEELVNEYRDLYDIVSQSKPYASAKVAILNSWGSLRTWGAYIVAHGLWSKLSYSYMGILESLSGMDMDVEFISFEDVKNGIASDIDVIINAGDAYTAFSGGENFLDPQVVANIREFVYNGGGFIGVGEPSAIAANGRFFQLADVLGVDVEKGFSQGHKKYFNDLTENHFITEDVKSDLELGEIKPNVYAISEDTDILAFDNHEVYMAANDFGKGRAFYITGLPYSFQNTRILKRAIHFVSHKEDILKKYFADDDRLEVAAFEDLGKYCVINNSLEDVSSKVYDKDGNEKEISVKAGKLIWIEE